MSTVVISVIINGALQLNVVVPGGQNFVIQSRAVNGTMSLCFPAANVIQWSSDISRQ